MDNPNDPFLVHLGKYERHRKIFVEPIPVLFHQLKQNLGNMTNATFINAAISSMAEGDPDESGHDSKSTATMFCVQSEQSAPTKPANGTQLPFWADQICSFSHDHITKLLPNAQVKSVEVQSLTVRQMLHQHDISDVLVVLIDTEGFDWQVLRQLPLHRASFRPVLIGFENQHLSKGDLAATSDFLHGHGYAVTHDAATFNTFALAMA
ncbi:hypothetical protein COCSUDRAFT_56281 [Coccomyxa subellipsoidea C-169]|uniref:Methyltransferase FkbM domain-containing protein n=1 Tax=Coccomyxa subellipsoidea (strain C-169) TaxID=574566 RepID=I0YTW1_COCSC|nr:hypothetical protein COCSUDRAFT_56281 [Coccomyxa subellipsoidea C-169]EIE21830.1 hypothetical protein COCSUDRAFT_56281 [Coccomyxa subellipsoidea C-169]|eukprot:XP_005646374.1 hypothetical protein COCSUDRAFT_56281 [Coccomyxa subellipsoidea C-169]